MEIFTQALSSLVEAGFCGRWESNYQSLVKISALKKAEKILAKNSPKGLKLKRKRIKNYYSLVSLLGKKKGQPNKNNNKLQGVSFSNVKMAIMICIICIILSSIVFLFEVFPVIRWRKHQCSISRMNMNKSYN